MRYENSLRHGAFGVDQASIGTVLIVDANGIISFVLLALFVTLFVVRGRAKRSDRRRDADEARRREQDSGGRSLF